MYIFFIKKNNNLSSTESLLVDGTAPVSPRTAVAVALLLLSNLKNIFLLFQ